MARPARIFTLNLGMQTVSMAEFQELPAGGLKLVALKTSELIVDPAADATRNSQIESVAAELRFGITKSWAIAVAKHGMSQSSP